MEVVVGVVVLMVAAMNLQRQRRKLICRDHVPLAVENERPTFDDVDDLASQTANDDDVASTTTTTMKTTVAVTVKDHCYRNNGHRRLVVLEVNAA